MMSWDQPTTMAAIPLSPLAGEGGAKRRMRGVERSETALWRDRNAFKYMALLGFPVIRRRVFTARSHLAPLDPPHPSLLRNDTFPREGGRE